MNIIPRSISLSNILGYVIIPGGALNRSVIRRMGSKTVYASHCHFHMCAYTSYEVQPMVILLRNCISNEIMSMSHNLILVRVECAM